MFLKFFKSYFLIIFHYFEDVHDIFCVLMIFLCSFDSTDQDICSFL